MNERVIQFLEMPVATKLAIAVGGIVTVLGLYWLTMYQSMSTEYDELEELVAGKNGLRFQVAQQRGIAENLDQFLVEVERLEGELKRALLELPDDREIDTLLAKVSSVGRDAGLEIRLFKEREEQRKDFYAEVPVEMEVYGSFHQLATFFDEVGHLERIVNLENIHMEDPKPGNDVVTLKTSVVATTFRFLDETERPKDDQKNDKKRRGGKGRRR